MKRKHTGPTLFLGLCCAAIIVATPSLVQLSRDGAKLRLNRGLDDAIWWACVVRGTG